MTSVEQQPHARNANAPYLERLTDRAPSTGLRSGSMEREAQDRRDERATNLALESMSPDNRRVVEEFLHDRRRRIGLGQRKKYAVILAEADRFFNATPWKRVGRPMADGWVDATAQRVGRGTLGQYTVLVTGLLRWVHGGKLPDPLQRAFDLGPNRDESQPRRVPDAHFLSLLHEARSDFFLQGLLWILYDAGFRIEEALSLNVGSVQFEDEGVWLRLPPKEKARFRLKTGPREVWVIQCRDAVNTLLNPEVHPFAQNPDAPLILTRPDYPFGPGPYMPLGPDGARRRLHGLADAAQVPHYTPHDFRHTKAYWCKLNDWADSKMCTFFGWEPGSKMPARYGRLVAADLRQTIRRDAGINNLGQKVVVSEADQKLRLLQDALAIVQGQKPLPSSPQTGTARPGHVEA